MALAVFLAAGCDGGGGQDGTSQGAWQAEAGERAAANESLSAAVEEPRRRLDGAYEFCIEQITEQLRSPATARFSERDREHEAQDGGSYLFTGTVDSENSFGALLRSDWACQIRWTGSGYVADSALVEQR